MNCFTLDSYTGEVVIEQQHQHQHYQLHAKSQLSIFGVALVLFKAEQPKSLKHYFIWRDSISTAGFSRLVRTIKRQQYTEQSLNNH